MRSTTVRSNRLPLELQQQIDACCDQFELALQKGSSPEVSQFLQDIPPEGHVALRRELAAIEIAYQHTQAHRDSKGLHLRCPHCQNQVELLAEAKLEEITCNSCGDTFSLIDEDSAAGGLQDSQRIGHFELITRLGTGGFGSVWEARDTELDRLVALKIPRKSQLSPREAEQFFREARTAAQLKHPCIVPVHEVGKEGTTIFIVTDLIRGVPMSDWLKAVRPSAQETARLCATLAEALSYAHSQGVIHRDLKPSNVMLDQEHQPHIMDFGLAKRELGEITMTVDGTVLGTPAYMSPEQALGKMHWVDRRTDIYSLGVMLFQMLTGELPYRGTAQQQLQQRIVDDAPDPRKLNAHIPADLATICLKCVERDANRRFASATEVAAELRRYLAGEPIKSRPISNTNRAMRWAKRKPWVAAALGLTAFLAVAGPIATLTILSSKQRIEAQHAERGRVIAREEQEKDALAKRLRAVKQELKSILKANPGIEEQSRWHKTLIGEFVQANQAARERLLEQSTATESSELLSQASLHLGWTYLLSSTQQHEQAVEHAIFARDMFKTLSKQQPDEINYKVLFAESLTGLSESLHELGREEQSIEAVNEAFAIRTALAQAYPEVLKYQIDQFFSSGKHLAFRVSKQRVKEEKKIAVVDWQVLKNRLKQQLTVASEDFYAVACYLTQHQSHLQHQLQLRHNLAPVATGHVLEDGEVE